MICSWTHCCFIFPFIGNFGQPGRHDWIDSVRCIFRQFCRDTLSQGTHLSTFSPLLACPKDAHHIVTGIGYPQSAASTGQCCHHQWQLPFCFILLSFFFSSHPAFSALLVHTSPHCHLLPTLFHPFRSDLVHEIHLQCNVPSAGEDNLKGTEHKEETQRSSQARAAPRQWRGVNQALWFSANSLHLQFTCLYVAFSQCFNSWSPENSLAFSLLLSLPPILCLHLGFYSLHTPSQPSYSTPRIANHHLSSQYQFLQ